MTTLVLAQFWATARRRLGAATPLAAMAVATGSLTVLAPTGHSGASSVWGGGV